MEKQNLSKEEVQALIYKKLKETDELMATINKERAELKRQNKIKSWEKDLGVIMLCILAIMIFMAMCK